MPCAVLTRAAVPPATLQIKDEVQEKNSFSYLRFSMDGNKLLAVTDGRVYVLDAFKGQVMQKLITGEVGMALEACFSPDGEYVMAGGREDRVWMRQTTV